MLELNKIYNIDCLEGLKQLEPESIDLIVTSPPYDNIREYDKLSDFNWDKFQLITKEMLRVLKQGGICVWIVGDQTIDGSETGTSFKQALFFKEIGFNLHDTMIYAKTGFRFPFQKLYHQVFEYMFVLTKGTIKTFNPISDVKNIHKGRKTLIGGIKRQADGSMKRTKPFSIGENGKRYNIWFYDVGLWLSTDEKVAFEHPAIFPDELARDCIISWSNKQDIVLDIFVGSGTTAKMCKQMQRNFIGFEINPEYCKIAEKRLAQQTLYKGGGVNDN
jgi:site-specific DNA-methyltransferase (adenine-specific)